MTMTLDQLQAWNQLRSKIAIATEHLNALCAEATQVGLQTEMSVMTHQTQALGDLVQREYCVLSVDVLARL